MIGLIQNKQTNEKQKLKFMKRVNIISAFFGGPEMDKVMRARMEKKQALEVDGCKIADGADCNNKEKNFIEKFNAKSATDVATELARLEKMVGEEKKMKEELKQWVMQRISILNQFAAKDKYDGKDDL
jgi:hypothetical protein